MSNILADDTKKPFQLRAFPVAARKLATDCASRAGLTLPEWFDRAVHTQARLDTQESVFPPGDAAQDFAAGKPSPQPSALMELVALMAAAGTLAAHTKLPGDVRALINQRARALQGLPPRHADHLQLAAAE